MSNEFTELEPSDYQQFYEQVGSKSLALQTDISKSITSHQLDLYLRTVDFIYRIITVLGIFAGFGFTALQHVMNFYLFMFGEAVLLSLILLGLRFIPKIYIDEYNSLEKQFKSYFNEVFTPRNKVLERINEAYIAHSKVKNSDVTELLSYDKKLMEMMSVSPKENYNPFDKYIWALLILGLVGLSLLLLSFFPAFKIPVFDLEPLREVKSTVFLKDAFKVAVLFCPWW